jgi:heptaprenyl diphosphate synthase
MGPFDFNIKKLPEYLTLVDAKLKSLAPESIDGVGRLLQARGKRLRPSLVIAIAVHSGQEVDESVINAAAAVELIHLASLVHDDIIDHGTLRWDVPTINSKEGNDMALLAGDYLLAKGSALASGISAEAGVLMAETIAQLCEGQAREIKDQFNVRRSAESLNAAIKDKTCALFIAACNLGGLVSGLSTKQTAALSEFAENFGIAFQYLDDVSDFTDSSRATGKIAIGDAQTGNYTLPVILSLQGPNQAALEKLLKNPSVSTEEILKILKQDKSIEKTLAEAQSYKQKALESLDTLDSPDLKNFLKEAFR